MFEHIHKPQQLEALNRRSDRRLMLERFMGVRVCAALVLDHTSVELVDHRINRGVHVFRICFDKDIFAARVQRDFCTLLQLLNRQDDIDVDDVVEMPKNPFHFRFDIAANCWRDIEMMPGEAQVHAALLKARLSLFTLTHRFTALNEAAARATCAG